MALMRLLFPEALTHCSTASFNRGMPEDGFGLTTCSRCLRTFFDATIERSTRSRKDRSFSTVNRTSIAIHAGFEWFFQLPRVPSRSRPIPHDRYEVRLDSSLEHKPGTFLIVFPVAGRVPRIAISKPPRRGAARYEARQDQTHVRGAKGNFGLWLVRCSFEANDPALDAQFFAPGHATRTIQPRVSKMLEFFPSRRNWIDLFVDHLR
jgi:hypothetical protein